MLMKKTHNKYKRIINSSKHLLKFGSLGLKNQSFLHLSKQKYFLLYNLILKNLKKLTLKNKKFKIWSPITFNKNLTKLPLESRMGKGKGSICDSSSFLKPNTILFEFTNLDKEDLNQILYICCKQMGKKMKWISRYNH